MPYLDDVLNPYQSLTGDLTPEDTLTGLLSEDGLLQGALAISDVVGVTELTELTDVSITNPINNDVLTYNDVTEKWENMPAQGGGGGTSDYNDLTNKPSINSVTLSGNKTTADLNISYNDLDDKPTIPTALDDLSDVNTSGASNGLVLTYRNGTWEPKPLPQDLPPDVEDLSNFEVTPAMTTGQVLKMSHGAPVTEWTNGFVSYNELTDRPTIPDPQVNSDWNAASGVAEILNKPTLATVATSGSYNDLTDKPTVPTTCSITKGSSMPSTFPVPNIVRRGNTVIVRFGVLLPAGTYASSDVLWNYSPAMVGLPALTFPVYGSGEVNLIKINTDGTITMNATKTFSDDTWLIGEAVFLTDG